MKKVQSPSPKSSLLARWSTVFVVGLVAAILFQWSYAGAIPEDLSSAGIKNVLVLTAHPDDEVMFFAPAILHLVGSGAQVYGLCLSSGNADGLGETRKIELLEAYSRLGVPSSQVTLIDDPVLPDGMQTAWNPAYVATKTAAAIFDHQIDTVLTFDASGVSSHPNHVSLHTSMWGYLTRSLGREAQNRMSGDGTQQAQPPLDPAIYALRTPTLARKYLGLPGALSSHYHSRRAVRRKSIEGSSTAESKSTLLQQRPDQLTFLSSPVQYARTLLAMRAHASQLVWFRYLYVLFSVLMFGGQLDRVEVQR
ncbi:hypothetical protein A4X13_0g6664 [Tilletia indica]|uniref:N-acetylglucosaminylphosphatidylinositol deacetylase n=1 Tax=Tilletia indica TaxID=43049 RepID=A0A177TS95_9BASI|nr:hypothetical protein A4X13_0g6664 [Tilletia indica]